MCSKGSCNKNKINSPILNSSSNCTSNGCCDDSSVSSCSSSISNSIPDFCCSDCEKKANNRSCNNSGSNSGAKNECGCNVCEPLQLCVLNDIYSCVPGSCNGSSAATITYAPDEPSPDMEVCAYNKAQKCRVCSNLNFYMDVFNNMLINSCATMDALNTLISWVSANIVDITNDVVNTGPYAWNPATVQGYNGAAPSTIITPSPVPDASTTVTGISNTGTFISHVKAYLNVRNAFLYYLTNFVASRSQDVFTTTQKPDALDGASPNASDYVYGINSTSATFSDYYGTVEYRWKKCMYQGYKIFTDDYMCYSQMACFPPTSSINSVRVVLLGSGLPNAPFPPFGTPQYSHDYEKITLYFDQIDVNSSSIFVGGDVVVSNNNHPTSVASREVIELIGTSAASNFLYNYNSTGLTSNYDRNTVKYFLDEQLLMLNVLQGYFNHNLKSIQSCGCVLNQVISFQV